MDCFGLWLRDSGDTQLEENKAASIKVNNCVCVCVGEGGIFISRPLLFALHHKAMMNNV